MKVGILGGTFDPVHIGHLVVAEQAQEQLALDLVLFMPAGRPWRKEGRIISAAEHRLAMLQLAIEGNDALGISDMELHREGPTYTADTIEQLAAERLDDSFHFIVGSDALYDMTHWHEPERILRHARLAVTQRDGQEVHAAGVPVPGLAGRVDIFRCPRLDVSSSNLRERIARGSSIRYLAPEAVVRYIAEHGLYRTD